MPHFFASNLRAVALPARTKNFEFIFEAKSLRDESAIIFAKSLAKSLQGEQKILLSKQKKGARFLVKFNKHFSAHSKEIIKSALKEYAELAGAEIVAHNLSENKIRVDSAYMLDWRGICALLGGNSSLDLHSADFANLGRLAQTSSLALRPKFAKNHESQTENPSVVDSALAQNLNKNNPRVSAHLESRPLRGAKNREQGCRSATADFLLEAEKRGSPPKSEKRQLLARRGSGAGGAALLREKSKLSGENDDGSAESSLDSAVDCNADSANLLAMTKNKDSAESPQDAQISKLQTQDEFAFLEIGFGSGRHILHLSQKHPTAKIIGLEIYRPAISQVLRQIEILGLQNLYLASIDARVLCEILPAKCLDRIYLHFPVPWDKNPQRRVLSAQFLGNAMRALKDDGFFELLTDSAEYFAFAKALAKGYKFKAEEGAKGEVVSKYEARWRRQEKVIYKLCIYPACGNSSLGLHSADLVNFGHCADFSLALRPKFTKNHESQTENPSVVDSANLTNSQNLGGKNCHSERSEESQKNNIVILSVAKNLKRNQNRDSSPTAQNDNFKKNAESIKKQSVDCNADSVNLLAMTENRDSSPTAQNDNFKKIAESSLDSAIFVPFSPTKIYKKEYFLHIKNKYIFEGGVVLFASFGAYYAPSSAYFVICGNEVSTISEIIPTRANIDALGLFMELCFDN